MDKKTTELKNLFEVLLEQEVPSGKVSQYVKDTFGKDKFSHGEMIVIGQMLKAEQERDTGAATFIRDTMGQKPTDKKEVSGSAENPFVVSLAKELQEWAQ